MLKRNDIDVLNVERNCFEEPGSVVTAQLQWMWIDSGWQNGLVADIDLLGVLEPYRGSGLGSALVKQAIRATQVMSVQYGLPAIGVVSLVDPNYTPIIRLHEKLGGQIRTDLQYSSGDIIVWYPLLKDTMVVETRSLAQQLTQFGHLLR